MPAAPALPPALRGLLEAGGKLVRGSTSGRVGMARMATVVAADALPAAMRGLPAALEQAREQACTPLGAKQVEGALKGAWGKAPGKLLDAFDPEPLAVTASAQVHRGTHDGQPVAIKVLRPGLAGTVRSDLALLDALAGPLRQVFAAIDAGAILREVREIALDELDLEHEASTQRQARRALRGVDGLVVPAPVMDLTTEHVLTTELLVGATLAGGAAPEDPGAVARVLVAAHVTAVRAGLVLTDPRPGHVVLLGGGGVGLLGAGFARPVDRARVTAFLDALAALRDGDPDGFAAIVAERLELLPAGAAREAYTLLEVVLGDLLRGPAALDAPALAAAGARALDKLSGVLALAAEVTPAPGDLALARSLGQCAALLSRLEVTEDWGALLLAAGR